jgi:hypothetical protein
VPGDVSEGNGANVDGRRVDEGLTSEEVKRFFLFSQRRRRLRSEGSRLASGGLIPVQEKYEIRNALYLLVSSVF